MTRTVSTRTRWLLFLVVIASFYAFHQLRPERPQDSKRLVETAHYAITSTATEPQTILVGDAVESLHAAYFEFFPQLIGPASGQTKLRLTLYKDQAEFKQHNKSALWAEAYYSAPTCHAYFAADETNPYHWMTHEATHQLNHEIARLPNSKWINEGLATYFGSSTIRDGKLIPGRIDVNTYPIWVVSKLSLTGDLRNDISRGKIIDLRALVSGVGGPNIDEKFNAYYVGYWSLSHFLLHFDNGRYASRYRQLITAGGSIDDFQKIVGPIDQIQEEWYGYLQQQVAFTRKKR
jgi:hypothetical protein